MNANKRRLRPSQETESIDSGILNERILLLVFESIKWDLHTLCITACVNRKLRAVAKRLLWREMCVYRAPSMTAALTNPSSRVIGGWDALAKLMFFCCGCESSRNFNVSRGLPGHFVKSTRFSKTSGKSFLTKRCRGDLLYVSDPCEHQMRDAEEEEDLGVYRGVFREFMRSRTRECLIKRGVELEEKTRCPYCGARVWSMTTARLIPKSAARRLGSLDGGLEYFVCLNGHLYGTCWLVSLSSDDEENSVVDDEYSEDDLGEDGNRTVMNGSSSLTGKGSC